MRKICFSGLLVVGLMACAQSDAVAQTQTITEVVGIEGFGADDGGPIGSFGDLDLIAEVTFTLPAINSFDSIGLQLAHTYGSDVQIELVDSGGATTVIIIGQGEAAPFTHDDGTDLGDTAGNAALLANVVDYELVATAGTLFMDHTGGGVLAAGTYGADAWVTGGFAAGDWTVRVLDAWDTGDTGSLGEVSATFTLVPEPGTIALAVLAMGSILGLRRRNS